MTKEEIRVESAVIICLDILNESECWAVQDYNVSQGHLLAMCDKLLRGEIKGEKAHRWLGWIQGSMCAAGIVDLESCKIMNSKTSYEKGE